jgi:hypothetical protein
MPIVESFIAYDEQQNQYEVNVFETPHSPLASGHAGVRDYSIAATGEVLDVLETIPLILRIKSTNTIIVDIRDQ